MARGRKATHICESCHKPIEITRWEYINNRQDKDKLPLLRSYSLFNNFCPYCGERTFPDICLLYQDADNKVVIYYIDGEHKEAKKQEVLKHISEDPLSGYSYRVVTNRVTFIQKVEMLLSGYDDRILEPAKCFLLMLAQRNDDDEDGKNLNIWFELDENENAVWNFSCSGECSETLEITPEMYAEYVDTFGELVDALDDLDICRNEDWAALIAQDFRENFLSEEEQSE